MNLYVPGFVTTYSIWSPSTSPFCGSTIFATPDKSSVASIVIVAPLTVAVGWVTVAVPFGFTLSMFGITIVSVVWAPLLSVAVNEYVPFCSTEYTSVSTFSVVPSGFVILTTLPSESSPVAVIATSWLVQIVTSGVKVNVGGTFVWINIWVVSPIFPALSIALICKYVLGPSVKAKFNVLDVVSIVSSTAVLAILSTT